MPELLGRGLFLGAMLLASAVACTPKHSIKPLPDFVSTGLEPGDRVTVATHDGETREFVITEIRRDIVRGENEQFALQDLASIQKHAWKRPKSPCGGEKPLGCSIPLLINLASESHSHYREKFYDACAQHDYCYRHGFASYGLDRKSCDDEFLTDMQKSCPGVPTSKIGKVFGAIDGSLGSRNTCLSVADDFYTAVRRYGDDKYETIASTYCEYNGPPVSAGQSVDTAAKPE
jgi:hypothetical protein